MNHETHSITFFFPESKKMTRGRASFYAYQRGFGKLRQFGHRAPLPVARLGETWRMKQKNLIIRELTIICGPDHRFLPGSSR